MFNKKYKKKILELEAQLECINKNEKDILLDLKNKNRKLTSEIKNKSKSLELVNTQVENANKKLIKLSDDLNYNYVGLYDFDYKCSNSKEYELKRIKNLRQQKEFVKGLKCMALSIKNSVSVDNNNQLGNKLIKKTMQICLENFNLTCDKLINKINYTNYTQIVESIDKVYNKMNKHLDIVHSAISPDYYDLKQEQASIQFELQIKLQDEKDEKKFQDEILKDSLKAELELKKQKEEIERKLNKLRYDYNKNKNNELIKDIDKLEKELVYNNYSLTHKRAGYVYVVSNSDMKDGQIKIGITRRKVEQRMSELGSGASHSFGMNVHGAVFVNDCFEVESDVHEYLKNKRINTVNKRKEWFYTTLDEVKDAFYKTHKINIELDDSDNVYDNDYLLSKNKFNFL